MSAFYLLSTYFMEGDQIDPPPQKKKKLPSKSPALLGLTQPQTSRVLVL